MRNKTVSVVYLTVILSILVPVSITEAFSGAGSGTEQDPYLIYSAEQMNEIGTDANDWDKHFKLMSDIDLSAYTGTQFNIIGYYEYDGSPNNLPFTGVFDGADHTISNFTYATTDTDYIGLFGYVGPNAEIKDLTLIDPNINAAGDSDRVGGLVGWLKDGTISGCGAEGGSVSGDWYTGGLVGYNCYDGTIENSYATGNVSGDYRAGGLVGVNNGTISNCYATGNVSGEGSIGGLVGINEGRGTISNCYATGNVSGEGSIGGLVGYNYAAVMSGGTISNCYATGTVSGGNYTGGLVGCNRAMTSNCYATGKVKGNNRTGGLVGGNFKMISNCYATGAVDGNDYTGGLVGISSGTVTASFWDIETTGQSESDGGEGKTTAEMQTKSTFTDAGWDFEDVWDIIENTTYPFLRVFENKMIKPVEGKVICPFHGYIKNGKLHEGIDINGDAQGRKVKAAASGKVVYVDRIDDSRAGKWVWIEHGDINKLEGAFVSKISTRYLHLDTIDPNISPSNTITQGTAIGTVGNTGCPTTVPHLHFEVRQGDIPTNLDYRETTALNPEDFVQYTIQPWIFFVASCPVDLTITDPDGFILSEEINPTPTMAQYIEVKYFQPEEPEENLQNYDSAVIYERKIGDYLVTVIPEPNALPTDTYNLQVTSNGQTMVLAKDVQIQDIPAEPYEFESKLNRSDFDIDGDVDQADLATLSLHWLQQDCNYPDWCEGADLNYNGLVDFIDFAIFAENWLWAKIPADLDMDWDVDFVDYAFFASHWMNQNCTEPDWCSGTDLNKSGSVDWYDLAQFAEYWLEDDR